MAMVRLMTGIGSLICHLAVRSPVVSKSVTTLIGRARFSGSAMNPQIADGGASNSKVRSTRTVIP
jgi:hypothetical protein